MLPWISRIRAVLTRPVYIIPSRTGQVGRRKTAKHGYGARVSNKVLIAAPAHPERIMEYLP